LKASFPSDVSVEREHFYGEGDLILDTLAGAVAGTEKFEVLKSVVGLVAVNVVDSLPWVKVSAEMLRHHVAVLKDLFGFGSFFLSNGDSQVPVPGETSGKCGADRKLSVVLVGESLAAQCLPASFAACSCSTDAVTGCGERGAAYGASFGFHAGSTGVRAFSGAVKRILAESFSVLAQFSGVTRKWFPAGFAGKMNRDYGGVRTSVLFFVGSVTSMTAELSTAVFRLDGEGLAALVADELNRHIRVLVWGESAITPYTFIAGMSSKGSC